MEKFVEQIKGMVEQGLTHALDRPWADEFNSHVPIFPPVGGSIRDANVCQFLRILNIHMAIQRSYHMIPHPIQIIKRVEKTGVDRTLSIAHVSCKRSLVHFPVDEKCVLHES